MSLPPNDFEDHPTEKLEVSNPDESDAPVSDDGIADVKTHKLPSVEAVEDDETRVVQVSEADVSQADVSQADDETDLIRVSDVDSSPAAADETDVLRFGDGELPTMADELAERPTTKHDAVSSRPAPGDDVDSSSAVTTKQDAVDGPGESEEKSAEPLQVGTDEFSDDATEYVPVSQEDEAQETPRLKAVDKPQPRRGAEGEPSHERSALPSVRPAGDESDSGNSAVPDVDEQLKRLGMARSTPKSGSYPAADDQKKSFYSLPAVDTDGMGKVRSASENLLRAGFVAIVVAVLVVPLITYLAADRWMELPMVMLAMLLATGVPSIAIGIVAVWPPNQRPSSTTVLVGVMPGLIAAVLLTTAAAFWGLPEVRMEAVGLTNKPATVMDKVLRDDSVEVAAAGCRLLLDRVDIPRWRQTVLSGMTLRPEVAARCLENADPDVAARLGRGIAKRWHQELMAQADNPDPERNCLLASEITKLPIATAQKDAHLLECTLSAPTQAAQKCCARALTDALGENKRERLERVRATIPLTRSAETAVALLTMAFQNRKLSAGQNVFAKSTNFEGQDAREVAIEIACAQIDEAPDIAPYLAAGLEGECRVDVAEIPAGRETWDTICAETVASLVQREPLPLLCERTRAAMVGLAANAASGGIRHGLRTTRRKGLLKPTEEILPPVSREGLTDPDSILKSNWVGKIERQP